MRLVFEWQHQEDIRGAELQATWAALKIMLGDECLTRVLDHSARTIRSNIYVPLYPYWIARQPGNWSTLKRIRKGVSSLDAGQLPWNQGYELARYVRKKLGVNGTRPPSSCEVIADWLDISLDQLQKSMRFESPLFAGLEAIVWENENRSPGFILKEKGRKENQIFSFCRALCDYFVFPHAPSLVSGVNTERQKRNRAFAAEFLVPADAVRKAIPGRDVSQEDMDEIAYDMGVSSYVIYHQVKNHQLALVSTD